MSDILTFGDWVQIVSTLVLVISILIAYHFSARTLGEIKNQMWISVFSEYTKRYSEIIRELPDATSDPKISALNIGSKKERDKIMGLMRAYFDLCSEEHYLYRMGKIDDETWHLWERGLAFTIKLPTFKEAWKKISEEGYEAVFIEYVNGIMSA